MKLLITGLIAAASLAAVTAPATEASAQPGRWHGRGERHHDWNRGHHDGWRRTHWRRHRECYRVHHRLVCSWR